VVATATDNAGNSDTDGTNNELEVDTTPPTVTVDTHQTDDTTPEITGGVDDNSASIEVLVDGNSYAATNNGGGTWTLADGAVSALADGTYNVTANATDLAGNTGTDGTSGELLVDTIGPAVTVTPLDTTDTTPTVTGTVDDGDGSGVGAVVVTVDGNNYPATVTDTSWTANVTNAVADGAYDVLATATDNLGNVDTDNTTDELTVDSTAPSVAVRAGHGDRRRGQLRQRRHEQ
jgi:hypothetical protein